MKLKAGMWVVVADGARGVVLVNENTAAEPQLRAVRSYGEHHGKTSELGDDKPGRAFELTGRRRSATEGPDLHQRAEDAFIAGIVADLAKDAAAKTFDHVVVVAPPVALGTFRKLAGPELNGRIVAWIDKDLTKETIPHITASVVKTLEG